MRYEKTNVIEITAENECFETAHSFVKERLGKSKISREIQSETLLVFEALFHNIVSQGFGHNTVLTLKAQRSLGEINIVLGFEGKPFIPIGEELSRYTPEDHILKAYDDKVDYSYRSGYNSIRISVKRNFQTSLLLCLSAILLAILVYIPIHVFMPAGSQIALEKNIVFPLVKLFANAMLMVGAPVTFFSLVKNITDTYIISERGADGRRLQLKTIVTSVIVVLLAVAAGFLIAAITNAGHGYLSGVGGLENAPSFSELISSLIAPSIFEPFETFMPFPLIIVSLIVTYAFCSVGKYFDKIKKAVDACYTLFSRMLHVVMFALPVFCFLAFLCPLLENGFGRLLVILELSALAIASLIIPAAFYLVRLLIGGVKLKPFFRHLPALFRENYRIGSVIDAVPFNIRYCARNYGMKRRRISKKLSLLAQLNLDGNCYLIMLIAMLFVFMIGSSVSWLQILMIAILVVFLSFGAPNQPGSVLIGTLIIALYLQAEILIPTAIYLEAIFGAFQNMVNVAGDVVTIAIEEADCINSTCL